MSDSATTSSASPPGDGVGVDAADGGRSTARRPNLGGPQPSSVRRATLRSARRAGGDAERDPSGNRSRLPLSRFRADIGPRRRRRGGGGNREGAGDSIEELHAASVDHGIPVIVVRDDADWTRLAALARTAVAGAAADSLSGVRLGDMFAFANAVATMTNGATSIVDPTGHVVGYSTIPGQPIDDLRRETTLTLQERTLPARSTPSTRSSTH